LLCAAVFVSRKVKKKLYEALEICYRNSQNLLVSSTCSLARIHKYFACSNFWKFMQRAYIFPIMKLKAYRSLASRVLLSTRRPTTETSPKFSLIGPARLFLFLAHYIAHKWSTIASVESGYTALKSPALMDGSLWIFRKSKTDEDRDAPYV
jgi:hypothetical protein